ncbi:MAG: hypothetical protein NTW78_12630 [Campylobacterales bacterium]|nr:hypothetical protein [Campylobacterales bacterium]
MKMKKITMALVATAMMATFTQAADVNAVAAPVAQTPMGQMMGQGQGQMMGQGQSGRGQAMRDSMTFEQMKTRMTTNLEKRAVAIKTAQECVNKATTKDQLVECVPSRKGKRGNQPSN